MLESLYASGSNTEAGLRVVVHGARQLDIDAARRACYYSLLKQIYEAASRLVHGQRINYTDNMVQQIKDAQVACRKGILKMLNEGMPNAEKWRTLIFCGKA